MQSEFLLFSVASDVVSSVWIDYFRSIAVWIDIVLVFAFASPSRLNEAFIVAIQCSLLTVYIGMIAHLGASRFALVARFEIFHGRSR